MDLNNQRLLSIHLLLRRHLLSRGAINHVEPGYVGKTQLCDEVTLQRGGGCEQFVTVNALLCSCEKFATVKVNALL